ncbi:schistosomin-like [Physella acuta]|uniref:schistosomin-like n=1 Tax=Physella acuta TaxID=109671 RepID=UPI0027DC19CB|nr:schistosomin-like [Physella acuta]
MIKEVFLLSLVVCAVLATENYWCPKSGDAFQCFESAKQARFCLSNGQETKTICGKCRKKFEFCRNGMKSSTRPDVDCGRSWQSTPCTDDISEVPTVF